MTNPIPPFEAILFDCDGVLVDSEPITHGVLRDMLAESGWDMPLAECMRHFIGRTVRSQAALIESRTGQPLTDDWMTRFYARRDALLRANLLPIDGAPEAVRAAHAATSGRIAVASGADLAAAASLSVLPARSLVIEDTPTGVAAGKAAGATVWAYCPAAHLADDLRAAGADLLFPSMAELPARWRQVGLGPA